MQILKKSLESGTLIIVMTQCLQGEVNDIYETGRVLIEMGAILGYDMSYECITAKLSYLMGKGYSNDKIKQLMMTNLRGELTDLKKASNTFTLANKNMVMAVSKVLKLSHSKEIQSVAPSIEPLLVNAVTTNGNVDLMRQLALQGLSFNQFDYRGRSPIHIVAISNDLNALKFLISQRVDLNKVDSLGMSALYLACYHKNKKIVKLLLAEGAKVIVPK